MSRRRRRNRRAQPPPPNPPQPPAGPAPAGYFGFVNYLRTGLFELAGLVAAAVGAYKIWSSDAAGLYIYATLFVGLALIWSGAVYWLKVNGQRRWWRRSSWARHKGLTTIGVIAMVVFAGLPLLLLTWGAYKLFGPDPLAGKTVVYVADFKNVKQDGADVSENIFKELRGAAHGIDPNVVALPLGVAITERDGGSVKARELGEKKKGAIIVWGWHDDQYVHAYFEVLRKPKQMQLKRSNESLAVQAPEAGGLNFRARLSGHVTYMTLVTLGLLRFEAGDYAGAVSHFSGAIEQPSAPSELIDPAAVYLHRGEARIWLQQWEAALEDLGRALTLTQDGKLKALSHALRGEAYTGLNQPDAALPEIDAAIALDPRVPEAFHTRGNIFYNRREFDRAVADYTRALELDPSFRELTLTNRGGALAELRQHERALRDLEEALTLRPDLPDAYINRAKVYFDQARYAEALADYNHAVALDTDIARAFLYRGWTNLLLDDGLAAAADARRYIELQQWEDAFAPYAALVAHFGLRKAGREEEARRVLEEARANLDEGAWPFAVVRHLRGEIDQPALLQEARQVGDADGDQAKVNRLKIEQETEARAFVAVDLMLRNRPAEAEPHLSWLHAGGEKTFVEYLLATTEAKRRGLRVG